MRKSPTNAELDQLVAITMNALPDSLCQRKSALVTLLFLLPRTYAGRADIGKSLQCLRAHEQAQARFTFSQGGEK